MFVCSRLLTDKPCFRPHSSATRRCEDLSGLWHLAFPDPADPQAAGPQRIPGSAMPIAVPGSFNDQLTDPARRNTVGDVWYYRTVQLPGCDGDQQILLHFGSVNYRAEVFLGGRSIGGHEGGHLPFVLEVPETLHGQEVLLAVRVNNELTAHTLPPGSVKRYTLENDGIEACRHENHFDFFHYSGIHRKVHLLRIPKTAIASVRITTETLATDHTFAELAFTVEAPPDAETITYELSAPDHQLVASGTVTEGKTTLRIEDPLLWDIHLGHRYALRLHLHSGGNIVDSYTEHFGIRTVEVAGQELHLNGRPIYLKGFGRHEDFFIFGRHLPDAVLVHDFNIMKAMGANSFRTSHYPYSEETLELADQLGFLVIGEGNAVGMNTFDWKHAHFGEGRDFAAATLETHLGQMEAQIRRDQNRPSVILWCVGNEAATYEADAYPYFETVVRRVRALDPTRPVTIAYNGFASADADSGVDTWSTPDRTMELVDIISLNRYACWYGGRFGELDAIFPLLKREFDALAEKYDKPIFLSEFGADAISGEHGFNPLPFTEDYQCAFIAKYCQAFDACPSIIGEHVWNFADFETKPGLTRMNGNKKGVFTRARQPKALARQLQQRWLAMESRETIVPQQVFFPEL